MDKHEKTAAVPDKLREAGGLKEGASRAVSRDTGVPEATVYGVGSFYHLLARPDAKVRVCTGLSCLMGGAEKLLHAAMDAGLPVEGVSCLAGCDVPPAVLRDRRVLPSVSASADVEAGRRGLAPKLESRRRRPCERGHLARFRGARGGPARIHLALNLHGQRRAIPGRRLPACRGAIGPGGGARGDRGLRPPGPRRRRLPRLH